MKNGHLTLVIFIMIITAVFSCGVTPQQQDKSITPSPAYGSGVPATPTPALLQDAAASANLQVNKPIAWPLPHPSSEQIVEVVECDYATLAAQKYPTQIELDQAIVNTSLLETSCDWAALVSAYTVLNTQYSPLPEAAIDAFRQLLFLNPSFALKTDLMIQYFNGGQFVEAPTNMDTNLSHITIKYDWNGLGTPVNYTLDIDLEPYDSYANYTLSTIAYDQEHFQDPNDNEKAPLVVNTSGEIDSQTVNQLTGSLTDLIPIDQPVNAFFMTDNYPDWQVSLEYDDGRKITANTYGSNFIPLGGPWQITIDGKLYMQYSIAFASGIHNIILALNLPVGEPAAMTTNIDNTLFDQAYQEKLDIFIPLPTTPTETTPTN